MKWPGRWSSEYFDYKEDELKNSKSIYDRLNPLQVQAVKKYFRWRTKNRFGELCKNTSLIAKPKKAEIMSRIMGNATDWIYDGCVDTGYLGGGHCELGHALRYEHYAYSPSINRQIVFGVTCAADFFGIEPDRLRKISKVQGEILEEVKEILFIMETGKHKQYRNFYYGDLPKVIDMFRSNLDEVFGAGWNKMMGSFLECNLPFTRSMVDKYYFIKKRIYEPKLAELQKASLQSKLLGDDPAKKQFYANGAYSELFYVTSCMQYIEERPIESEHDLECNKFVLSQAMEFSETYRRLSKLGISDFKKLVFGCKNTEVHIHTSNGDRKATQKEREEMPSEAFTKEVLLISPEKYRMICIFGWGIFGFNQLYADSRCEKSISETVNLRIEKSARLMKKALKWLNSDEFESDMKKLKEAITQSETYPESATNEVTSNSNDADDFYSIACYILDNCPRNTRMSLLNIAIDIADKYVNSNYEINLSDKQKKVLRQTYDMLTHKQTNKSEAVAKAEYVLTNISGGLADKYDFEIQVCQTVSRTGRATEKQVARINKVYDALKATENPDNTSVQQDSAQQIFIDEPEESNIGLKYKRFNGAEQQSNDINSAFADDTNTEYGNDYEYEAMERSSAIMNIPTVVEISMALGQGQFRVEGGIYGE